MLINWLFIQNYKKALLTNNITLFTCFIKYILEYLASIGFPCIVYKMYGPTNSQKKNNGVIRKTRPSKQLENKG